MKKTVIEVATAHGCSKCSKAITLVADLVGSKKDVQIKEVNIAEQPEYAIKHSIMSTPALVINGKLEFTGLPKREELEKVLWKSKKDDSQ